MDGVVAQVQEAACGQGQQGGDGRVRGVVAAVREDDLVVALGDRLGGGPPEVLDRAAETGPVLGDLEEDRERDRPEAVRCGSAVERADLQTSLRRRIGWFAKNLWVAECIVDR